MNFLAPGKRSAPDGLQTNSATGGNSRKVGCKRRMQAMVRLLLCATGAMVGLALSLSVTGLDHPFLLASLGGSTVFLFGLTRTPAAQPRALIGGHLGGALIGILCFRLFGDATWVYALSVALTLTYMLLTKTVHPPAGANPLLMIHHHASLSALWEPVGLGLAVLAAVACIWTRIVPGMVHYPVKWMDASPPNSLGADWEER
ncbi:MAG: HPP family protein [Burkholderiaceae bacterium]